MDIHFTEDELEWVKGSFTKIVAYVENLEELEEIERQALQAGLNCHKVIDKGLTEFHNVPTVTCLAIGPNKSSEIDPITGHLKLL
jgi:PTH2 family peptidyl-tRNA hydrolase